MTRIVDGLERTRPGRWVRRFFVHWQPWFVVFAIGMIGTLVWTLTISRNQARDEAVHAAEIVANADAQRAQCIGSIPVLRKINGFIEGSQIVDAALVKNSLANLKVTPKGTHLYAVRAGNLQRLTAARDAAAQVKFPVPTKTQCRTRRAALLNDR